MSHRAPIALVVFDLDDTLCDYRAARAAGLSALQRLLDQEGVRDPCFLGRFSAATAMLRPRLDTGAIDESDYQRRRFNEAVGPKRRVRTPTLAGRLRRGYLDAITDATSWVQGGREVVHELARSYRIAVLTNGASELQRAKLARLELPAGVQDQVFISGETGFRKPDQRAFMTVLDQCRIDPGRAVMVGDSLSKDVHPATAIGMRAVLFAPDGDVSGHDGLAVSSMEALPRLLGQLR